MSAIHTFRHQSHPAPWPVRGGWVLLMREILAGDATGSCEGPHCSGKRYFTNLPKAAGG